MAGHRCSSSVLLVILCSLSVFIVANSQETTPTGHHHAVSADNPQTTTETGQQTAEQPVVEERQWEATEVEKATLGDAETDKHVTSTPETTVPSWVPKPKDDFQEELVIRPLHSGDIYASFQFRTLWETDFITGDKGKLTASSGVNTSC